MLSNIKKINLPIGQSQYFFKENSLDFLRLILAILVIIAHTSFPTIGEIGWRFQGGTNIGMFSVYFFFLISGILISRSFENDNNIFNFFKKRFLRIFPGLWFCLIIISLFFIPLWYYLEYGLNKIVWVNVFKDSFLYTFRNIGGEIMQQHLDIASKKTSFTEINISLWSIIQELRAYILIPVLFYFGFIKENYKLIILFKIYLSL